MKRVLVVGCGFVGEAAADRFQAAGWDVTGWTATQASADRLVKPYAVEARDIADESALAAAAGAAERWDLVVDCVSSGRGGVDAYRRVYLEGARRLLRVLKPERFIFTSSTSVYAQTDGAWVDEQSPAEPDRETGRILRETEEVVLAAGGAVLRLAGLYGPGRSTMLAKALAGETHVEGDGRRWMNFCHRDDAASAILAVAQVRELFNVVDDCPTEQGEIVQALAEMFGQPAPTSAPPDYDRRRGWTSKRVSNARLRALGWAPQFPSFLDWARSAAGE